MSWMLLLFRDEICHLDFEWISLVRDDHELDASPFERRVLCIVLQADGVTFFFTEY